MKRHFGSFWTRSPLGSGITLTDVEYRIVEELVQALPEWLRVTVEAQFAAYNLVQREVDGRALNWRSNFRRAIREGEQAGDANR